MTDHLEPGYRPPLEDCSHDHPEYARRSRRPPRALWSVPPVLLGLTIAAAAALPWILLVLLFIS